MKRKDVPRQTPKRGKLDGSKNLPGTTDEAFERESRPGGPEATPLDDRYAAGTPGGGSEFGGLAGTNADDGAPENADLNDTMGGGDNLVQEEDEGGGPPYAGPSGGAVGGAAAEGRSKGGNLRGQRGLDPGGSHRGDSTVGADPDKG
jgi:hypothetical protein